MIYLILDTNFWIYISNGHNIFTNNADYEKDYHIEVFNQIKEKVDTGEFEILINDIIVKEWDRNKKTAKQYIKALDAKRSEEINSLVKVKEKIGDNLFQQSCKKINDHYYLRIKTNEDHLVEVEKLINSLPKVPVTDSLKLEVVNMAINKEKAPFKNNNKNNVADAIILFSSVDYLKNKMKGLNQMAVFVSANHKEYGATNDKSKFHIDLIERLNSVDISYHQNWKNLLDITEDMQYEIDYFNEIIQENTYFYCMMPNCDNPDGMHGFGYLDNQIRYADNNEMQDPNQTTLFQFTQPDKSKMRYIDYGSCVICSTTHLNCPECGELIPQINENQVYCSECESCFEIGISIINEDHIIYPISNDEFHL